MSNLTYDQQNQMLNTRKINREVGHYFDEKLGDSDKFKMAVAMDQQARQRPIYWGCAK